MLLDLEEGLLRKLSLIPPPKKNLLKGWLVSKGQTPGREEEVPGGISLTSRFQPDLKSQPCCSLAVREVIYPLEPQYRRGPAASVPLRTVKEGGSEVRFQRQGC